MESRKRFCLINSLFFLLFSLTCFATDTAFWKPYKTDAKTYGLFHFDKDDFSDYEGKIKGIEKIGEVSYKGEGRFGGCLELSGKSALKYETGEIFSGGFISIEGWVKIEKYPEDKSYVVYRPAVVDKSAKYDPEADKTKGFGLFIDSKGAFHLETTNCYYGKTTITSSPEGIIPLNQWVHIAGISAVFPASAKRLFLNGKEVSKYTLEWGQGLVVDKDEEKEPSAIYIGNNEKGDSGFSGLIDEVRIHTNVFKFWEKEDRSWAEENKKREIKKEEPYFLSEHKPILYLPLDGDTKPQISEIPDIKITTKNEVFDEEGVRNRCFTGTLTVSSSKLLDLKEGSIEFWFQPIGVNNISDFNVSFFSAAESFIFYIVNRGAISGSSIPLTLYFRKDDGKIQFIGDATRTEVYPGKWFQAVITWKDKEITLYLDGQEAGKSTSESPITQKNKGVIKTIYFSPQGDCAVDEVYLYDKCLTKEEVNNAYYIYKNPENLKEAKILPVSLNFQYFPSHNLIYYQLIPSIPSEDIDEITLRILNSQKNILSEKKTKITKTEENWEIPELKEGKYRIQTEVKDKEGRLITGDASEFIRKNFVWENNNLGITEEVPYPFEPVKAEGKKVSVVSRTYEMNDFGLWDKVVSKGKDILAGPITLKYTTENGEGRWKKAEGKFILQKPNLVRYKAEIAGDGISIKTISSIEVDGCMKVEMEILPGEKKGKIENLYLEIPLKEKEVELFHEVTDGPRINYSGRLPDGEGIVWDSKKAKRWGNWLNSFVPYIWLGKEERGLCWFGENDKGYITEKNYERPLETKPIQEIERKNGEAILRVYFINKPVILEKPTRLVFGLQASPTKPMPENWRKKLPYIPGGLAVTPWGGLHCSYQGPYKDDWTIVDKILEGRYSGKVEKEWFEEYNKKYNPPPTYGTWEWLTNVSHFAAVVAERGPEKPVAVYQEEMAACTIREEWKTYQDEWTLDPYLYQRDWPDEDIFRKGHTDPSGHVNFIKSYQDFGVYFADQWLKRGVSLYWDNTYPHLSYNYKTTDAYITEDGRIQPCLIIWNQREYQKRVYNQLQYWRKIRKEPLEWSLHMTNTLVLPIHTWGTANLDHELSSPTPFSPDWLRTETIGLQTGNYPLSLYPVYGKQNKIVEKLSDEEKYRIDWGMRMVHEIQRGPEWVKTISDLEKVIFDFGYGGEKVKVHNYWEEQPVLEVNNDKIKWIVLENFEDKTQMLIFSGWSEEEEEIKIRMNKEKIGFDVEGKDLVDAEKQENAGKIEGFKFKTKLSAPYGVKILKIIGDVSQLLLPQPLQP